MKRGCGPYRAPDPKGTYRPGERVPSVRSLSRQMQVSISTAVKAYFHLENMGLIEARPQSATMSASNPSTWSANRGADNRACRADPGER